MSKFHSTVSRRTFMKGLGIGAAGLSAAAATAPVFHDLDEAIGSPNSLRKRPWWVKEREFNNPTTEVDWSILKAYDSRNMIFNARGAQYWLDYVGADEENRRQQAQNDRRSQGLKAGTPRYSLRDTTLTNSTFYGMFASGGEDGFTGPAVTAPEVRGVSRWQGTPEENSRMMRVVAKLHGAADVSFVKLDPSTSRKLICTHDFSDDKAYVWADIDQPDQNATTRTIPNKCQYLMNFSMFQYSEGYQRGIETYLRYSMGWRTQLRIQNFLKGIGYLAVGPFSYTNNLSLNVGYAALGGIGEQGRNNKVISPEHGSTIGVASSILTDLPLQPSKPIDAGMRRFCRTCKKCASLCPGEALSMDTEPSWDVVGKWNNTGYNHWSFKAGACFPFNDLCGGDGCSSRCTFAKGTESGIHQVVGATLSVTPIFNSFFVTMDDVFGYGQEGLKDANEVWELEMLTFGCNTARGMQKVGSD